MNEPNRGFVAWPDLSTIPSEQKLQKGTSPTAWQAILTGSGRACEIDTWDFGGYGPYKTGKTLVDPKGVQAWLPADYDDSRYGWKRDSGWKLGECIWAQHGVWDITTDTLLKKDYFSKSADGRELDAVAFTNIYFMDHYRTYTKAIRSVHPKAIMFCQPPVLEIPPVIKGTPDCDDRMVYAPHYYDGITLMTKKWNRLWNIDVLGVLRGRYLSPAFAIRIGETAIRNCLRDQLKSIKEEGIENIGITPCVFTEIGIPYDMDDKYAYKTGDFSSQIRAMDANHFALEGSQAGYTLWTYTTINSHEWGDQWNGEDLSIFCVDDRGSPAIVQKPDVDRDSLKRTISKQSMSTDHTSTVSADGIVPTRAAQAFVRPSAVYTAGEIIESGFNLATVIFTLKLTANAATDETRPTEMFMPPFHFPKDGIKVQVSGGKWEFDEANSVLRWWHNEGEQEIKVVGVGMEAKDDESYVEMLGRNYGDCSVM